MEPNANPVTIQSYGRACLNCSRSKCRCITRPSGQGCERCHRLNKPCVPGDSTRKRNAQRNNIPIARIAQLEGKLDGLVSLLQSGPVLNTTHTPAPGSDPSPHLSFGTATTAPTPSSLSSVVVEPSDEEAEECLRIFRSHMLRFFAFMHLPDDVPWLRRERPFLFLCIIASASKSTQRKRTLAKEIKQTLAQRIILDNRAVINIDLLLGLLTFISWGHDQLLNGSAAVLSRFTSLAMALVFDLRLNKPSPREANMLTVEGPPDEFTASSGKAPSLEEVRAVLGCFVMSSIVSSYFAQIDAMQWTTYMDECLRLLSENRGCPSDESFTQQVRLQLISREIEGTKGTKVPLPFYLKAVQSKLDEIKASISPELQQDEILLASIYSTELNICELVIRKDGSCLQRLESLYACLNTVKSAVDNFFQLPPAAYVGFSFPFFTQIARYIVVLYKLSTLKDPAWDTGLVRATVDLLEVVDRIISNCQHASVTDSDGADSIGARTIRIFMSVRSWCGAKIGERTGGIDPSNDGPLATGERGLVFESMSLEGLDDMWVKDIFSYGSLEGDLF